MKISATAATILALIFTLVCFGFAVTGFTSLGDLVDPVQRGDAQGFAWFWTFLGGVGLAFGALSWWIARTAKD